MSGQASKWSEWCAWVSRRWLAAFTVTAASATVVQHTNIFKTTKRERRRKKNQKTAATKWQGSLPLPPPPPHHLPPQPFSPVRQTTGRRSFFFELLSFKFYICFSLTPFFYLSLSLSLSRSLFLSSFWFAPIDFTAAAAAATTTATTGHWTATFIHRPASLSGPVRYNLIFPLPPHTTFLRNTNNKGGLFLKRNII